MGDVTAGTVAPGLERRWAEIRGRIEAASGFLSLQGSVAWRTTPAGARVASLRFVEPVDGRRRQRAIYLGGDAELIRRARQLIERYREVVRWSREAEEAARFVAAAGAFSRRMQSTRPGGSARVRGIER